METEDNEAMTVTTTYEIERLVKNQWHSGGVVAATLFQARLEYEYHCANDPTCRMVRVTKIVRRVILVMEDEVQS